MSLLSMLLLRFMSRSMRCCKGALPPLLCLAMLTSGCASLPGGPLPELDGDEAQAARCGPAEAPSFSALLSRPAAVSDSAAASSSQAAQPSAQEQKNEIQGQLSIKLHAFGKTPAKGLSLGFFFSGNARTGRLDLITLMGSQLAQVDWAQDGVWLTDDKGRRRYESMEELSAAALGEALPLQALVSWMQGRPSPEWPSAPEAKGFKQLGWRIDLSTLDSKQLTASRAGSPTQRGAFVKVYLDR